MKPISLAIIGGGIGGLAAAIALRRMGVAVDVYEQAPRFGRVGAAINLTPNAVRVLDGLDLRDAVARRAWRPTHRVNRDWQSGRETSRFEMGAAAEARYGVPQLTTHRADLLSALEAHVPSEIVHLGRTLAAIATDDDGVRLRFEDGSACVADGVIGADGIHSVVRACLLGPEAPRATGTLAFRAFAPAAALTRYDLASFTKWWGPSPQSQLVSFLIDEGRELFVFATIADPGAARESWSSQASHDELMKGFADYHEEARDILAQCGPVLKTPLLERDPLPRWSAGRVTLLGDACHPMMPFMAQGAAMALEDAAILARCLEGVDRNGLSAAFARYEAARLPRTGQIQIGSRENQILPSGLKADWVYGFNAWRAPLPPAGPPDAAAQLQI